MDELSAGGTADAPDLSLEDRDATYVVVAAYNEASAIGDVVRELRARQPHVVVVDDGSLDATGEQAFAAGAVVLRHLVNRDIPDCF